MNTFIIHTDSACDLKPEMLESWGVPFTSLTFRFDGAEIEYANGDMTVTDFYAKMRAGGIAKTAAVNTEIFREAFEKTLKEGKDVLYIGFSSGLSTTYNSARIAAEELRSAYPDRKVITVDTLAASAGEGLLVYLATKKQKSGASIEETAAYIEDIKLKISIWFTVDDLVYLKRGGRVSPTVAFVGNMLGIKPVLHMDDEGHLVNVSKVRGRKTAIAALADKYGELATDLAGEEIFISHGDCLQDAEELADLLKTRYGATVEVITDVGPVIGAHSGPGTLALFFVGAHR
ncbi:MAG: DegV family protein [Clostridia bacterium]|nr:DegV family protein [Clostridia bacterium]